MPAPALRPVPKTSVVDHIVDQIKGLLRDGRGTDSDSAATGGAVGGLSGGVLCRGARRPDWAWAALPTAHSRSMSKESQAVLERKGSACRSHENFSRCMEIFPSILRVRSKAARPKSRHARAGRTPHALGCPWPRTR